MPPKPIASASCDTTLFLCKKLTFQIKIYTQTQVSCSISLKFSRGNICPLAINHQDLFIGWVADFTCMYFKIMSKVVKYTCRLRRYNYPHNQFNTRHFNIIF